MPLREQALEDYKQSQNWLLLASVDQGHPLREVLCVTLAQERDSKLSPHQPSLWTVRQASEVNSGSHMGT